MAIYFTILFVFVLLSIYENKLTLSTKNLLFIITTIFLILFAGLRGLKVDFDNKSYLIFYSVSPYIENLFTNSHKFFSSIRIEPSLIIIFSFVKSFFKDGFPIAIFLYALLSVYLKMTAIRKMTDFVMLSTLIYFSGIFLLQDMTQIRAAVAVGFILLSIQKIEEKKVFQFLIYISLAIFFHYSSILFIPFIFLNTKKIDKLYYILLMFIPLLLSIFKLDPLNFISKINLGVISEKAIQYITIQKGMKLQINIFNFNIILQIIISLFFIIYCENIKNKYAIILTKISCYGVALFYLFISIPGLAFRTNELLSSVQIILVPLLIYIIKPKALAEGIVISIAFLYIVNQLLINPIINSYNSILF